MRPAVVILGFVLGSAAAITFALFGTAIVFFTLRGEYRQLEGELGPLLVSAGLFASLTAAAAGSFYGEIKQTAWRRRVHFTLAVMLGAIAAYYGWSRT